MPPVSLDAIILQVFPYGETSRILRLLTASHGVQSVIAKGARRPRSPFGGILEPFAEGTATLYIKESRELQTLSAFDLTHSRHGLGGDLMRFGGASLIAEIVLRTASEDTHSDLFHTVSGSLRCIESVAPAAVETAVLSETWRLIACLGFAPELHECVDCNRPLDMAEDVKFDVQAGGIRCMACGTGAPGKPVPARARAALIAMSSGESPVLERTEGHWWLLQRYLEHHVLEGAELRSLGVIAVARGEVPCAD